MEVYNKTTCESSCLYTGLKLVVYSDSTVCSSCKLKNMHLWDDFLEKLVHYSDRVQCYFIFAPSNKKMYDAKLTLRTYSPNYPVFIDTLRIFEKENPHLSKNPRLHTFLLDENNNVLLVGNPLENKKIEEMFWKIVEERFGKRK